MMLSFDLTQTLITQTQLIIMRAITTHPTLTLILILLSFLLQLCICNRRKLTTISATQPSNTYKIPSLINGDTFLYNIAFDSVQSFMVYITQESNSSIPILINNVSTSVSYSGSVTVNATDNYYIQLRGLTGTNAYSLAITVNTVQYYTDVGIGQDYRVGIYYFVVQDGCTNAKFVSNNYDVINFFGILQPHKLPISTSIYNTNITQYALSSNFTIDISQVGQYAFIIGSSLYSNNNETYIIKQILQINIICFDHICGDQYRQGWQQCDNGNMSGCVNCVIDYGYSCGGDTSGTAACPCYTDTYNYNTNTKQCEINCKNVQYGLQLVQNTNDQCTCQPPYCFDTAFLKCRLGCPPVKVQTKFLIMGLVIGFSILGFVIAVVLAVKCYWNKCKKNNDVKNYVIDVDCGQVSNQKLPQDNTNNSNSNNNSNSKNYGNCYFVNNQWVVEDITH